MLTKGDRQEIRNIIQQELKGALYRMITIERGPRQQGDPEKVIKEEEWNVLDFLTVYVPRIEAAMRGMQADVDSTRNSVLKQSERLNAIGQVLLSMESAAKRQAMFSDRVRELDEGKFERGHDRLLERGNGDRATS